MQSDAPAIAGWSWEKMAATREEKKALIEFEQALYRAWSVAHSRNTLEAEGIHELLLQFNKMRTEVFGVKTSLGTTGRIVSDPAEEMRLL